MRPILDSFGFNWSIKAFSLYSEVSTTFFDGHSMSVSYSLASADILFITMIVKPVDIMRMKSAISQFKQTIILILLFDTPRFSQMMLAGEQASWTSGKFLKM